MDYEVNLCFVVLWQFLFIDRQDKGWLQSVKVTCIIEEPDKILIKIPHTFKS